MITSFSIKHSNRCLHHLSRSRVLRTPARQQATGARHDTDRRMLRSCRRAAKHFAHVCVTWVCIVRSASMKMPRSRTHLTGYTGSDPTASDELRRTIVLPSWMRLVEVDWNASSRCTITSFEDIAISVMPGFLWDTVYIHCESKRGPLYFCLEHWQWQVLTDFQNFFTVEFGNKFSTKYLLHCLLLQPYTELGQ